jgi:hypothetical protein
MYQPELLQEAQQEINKHIMSLGGKVEVPKFDYTKELRINNSSDCFSKPPGLD